MAKPPRRKVPAPNTNTTGEAYVDDTELEDGAEPVAVEDTTEEGFSEDTAEDAGDSPVTEDSEDETEAEAGVTFNYPTMEDMDEEEEDEEPETNVGVHFVGSTLKKDTPDALVKVRISCHKQFVVGGERYDMYPGKTYLVPKNVKDVLRENDLLRPL